LAYTFPGVDELQLMSGVDVSSPSLKITFH